MQYSLNTLLFDILDLKLNIEKYNPLLNDKSTQLLKYKDYFFASLFITSENVTGFYFSDTVLDYLFNKSYDAKKEKFKAPKVIKKLKELNFNLKGKSFEVFEKFQKLLSANRALNVDNLEDLFQKRKSVFSTFKKDEILGKPINKKLQITIQKLLEIEDSLAFEYILFLFVLISIFHEDLSTDKNLRYLYNEDDVAKIIPDIKSVTSTTLPIEHSREKLLSSPTIFPKTIYGRDSLIDDVAQQLKENHVVFLYGIGGIGKTQIAKNYIQKYRSEYDTIVYGTYPNTDNSKSNDEPNDGLKELLLSEDVFAFEPKMNRRVLSDGSLENDDDYAGRKLQKIKDLSNERTLIIVDNFDVMNDKLLSEFINGRYHLLITTRCSYENMYPMIKVKEIEDIDDIKQIFFKNYRCDIVTCDDPHLEELIELVNRHTYTIELIAKHMSNSGQSTLEMIDLLKKEGIICLNEEIRNDDCSTEVAFENLKKMFKIFRLSDEEKQILQYMCLMPLDGVKKIDFKKWAGLKSLSKVNNLIDRSWIIQNTNGIALHPIIKDVIMYEQDVSFENCKLLLDNLTITFNNTWSVKPEERIYYGNIAKSLYNLNRSMSSDDVKLYFSILYMFEHLDYYNLCEELLDKIYTTVQNTRTLLTGGYYYYAGDYQLHRMRYSKALDYLKISKQLFEDLAPDSFELAYVTKHIAHTYHAMYDHKDHSITIVQEAKNCLKQSRKIFETCGIDRNHPQMGSQWFAEGLNFYHLGDYDKAKECSEESLKIYMKLNGKINSDTTAPMRTLARIYSKQNKIDDAIEMQQDVIAIRGELWGKNQFKYFEQLETLSDIYVENNMIEKGVEALEALLKIMEDRIDDYKFYYNSIKEKLHNLKATT